MANHIPFVNTQEDCYFLKKYYTDSDIIRVSLEKIGSIKDQLPCGIPMWVDAGIDGCHHHLESETKPIPDYIKSFNEHKVLASRSEISRPEFRRLKIFANDVLNKCLQLKPTWITIPQLPIVEDASRNKINAALAKAAYEWKIETHFKEKLILPLIFTNQKQLAGRTEWRPRIDLALKRYYKGSANGIWIVDSSLSDQQGTRTFRDRFPALIDMHKYIKSFWPKETIVIAGPYWGMNLVLWTRKLCEYAAIGLGSAYTYYIPGGRLYKGKIRLAIPPLRRWVVASPELKTWLDKSLQKVDPQDIAYIQLYELIRKYDSLSIQSAARNQVAQFYKKWFNKIEKSPAVGRSLALYQDLSSAYVIGKQLPTLPPSSGTAKRPERVAEYYMLNCL